MRAGEKLLNALFIFLEHVKTWNLTLTTHSRSCFFEVLIVQCQNSIKYILLRSLSAAMFTWPCKTNFTTVPDPLELQILLEDQTATELLFQSYAATTTIDRMTWLACISHYVTGHVHKTGHIKLQRYKTLSHAVVCCRFIVFSYAPCDSGKLYLFPQQSVNLMYWSAIESECSNKCSFKGE